MSIHINRGTGRHYLVRVHYRGDHKNTVRPYKFQKLERAAIKLARLMAANYDLNRGDVLLCADWTEPQPVLHMDRP